MASFIFLSFLTYNFQQGLITFPYLIPYKILHVYMTYLSHSRQDKTEIPLPSSYAESTTPHILSQLTF